MGIIGFGMSKRRTEVTYRWHKEIGKVGRDAVEGKRDRRKGSATSLLPYLRVMRKGGEIGSTGKEKLRYLGAAQF